MSLGRGEKGSEFDLGSTSWVMKPTNPDTVAARSSTTCTTRLALLSPWLAATGQAQFIFTTNNGALTITSYTGAGGEVSQPRLRSKL